MRTTLKKEPEVKKSARISTKRVIKSVSQKTAAVKTTKAKAASPRARKVKTTKDISLVSEKSPRTKSINKRVSRVAITPAGAVADDVVFVPSKASLRLLEKVQIYRLWYQNQLPGQVAKAAIATGYTFALIGTFLAAASFLNLSGFGNTAALVCAQPDDCRTIDESDLLESSPLVTFLNTVPDKLTADTDIVIRLDRGEKMTVYLEALFSGDRFVLTPIEQIKTNEFKYLLVKQNLKPGTYEIKAESITDGVTHIFKGSQFTIEGQVLTSKITPVVEDVLPADSATTSTPTAGATETISTTTRDEESAAVSAQDEPLALSVEELSGATYLRIKTATYAPDSVYVYSKPNLAPTPVLLGQATLVQGDWVFSLSALDLPFVTHELFASFVAGGKNFQTSHISYVPVINPSPTIAADGDLALLEQKINLALQTAEINMSKRQEYFSTFASTTPDLFATNDEAKFASTLEIAAADTMLADNASALDLLLSRYAAAVQGGQKYLLNLALDKEQSWYNALLIQSGISSPVLETVLAQRLQILRDKVREDEERYMTETNDLTTRDSDQDGLADFDEIAYFKSDSTKTDTDYDGVIDSIEVLAGFDPNMADIKFWPKPDAFSPSVSKTEAVTISSVVSINDKQKSESSIFAVINGQSTPYTYVWIHVPTLDVLGLIRTNSQGNFSYTLEVPIPEQPIEVVAMLVDNTGAVVAASPAFSFAKKDNKLVTAVAIGRGESYLAAANHEYTNMTTIATAIGVVVLGFVLLLLGGSLRRPSRGLAPKAAQL